MTEGKPREDLGPTNSEGCHHYLLQRMDRRCPPRLQSLTMIREVWGPPQPQGCLSAFRKPSSVAEAAQVCWVGTAGQARQAHHLIFCLVQVIVSRGQAEAGLVHLQRDGVRGRLPAWLPPSLGQVPAGMGGGANCHHHQHIHPGTKDGTGQSPMCRDLGSSEGLENLFRQLLA